MSWILVAIAMATAPYLPGDVITYEHGEGLIAGDAVLNEKGYWETQYSFGPIDQSPLDEKTAAIIQDMLDGKPLPQGIVSNTCTNGRCIAGTVYQVEWQSECEVRDTYAYRNMEAVRIEWECDGVKDGFNIVDFENGAPAQLRYFGPDRTIWIKAEVNG